MAVVSRKSVDSGCLLV